MKGLFSIPQYLKAILTPDRGNSVKLIRASKWLIE